MPYVTRAQVEAKIPPPLLLEALDDDGDGAEDDGQFDAVVAAASTEVDGYLGGLFEVPFTSPPAKAQAAAFAFVCEMIYQRRNVPEEKNPFTSVAKWWRTHLQRVGNRELPFDAATDATVAPGAVITEDTDLDGSLR
jgi:phage gp36-like protein